MHMHMHTHTHSHTHTNIHAHMHIQCVGNLNSQTQSESNVFFYIKRLKILRHELMSILVRTVNGTTTLWKGIFSRLFIYS